MAAQTYHLFSALTSLKGVAEATCKSLRSVLPALGDENDPLVFRDLLFHMPFNLVDRRDVHQIKDASEEGEQVFCVRVLEHLPAPPAAIAKRRRIPYRITVEDDSGTLTLNYFRVNLPYIKNALPVGEVRYISGRVSLYDGKKVMAHPSWIAAEKDKTKLLRIHPVYPASKKVSSRQIANLTQRALTLPVQVVEWIDANRLKQFHWPNMFQALKTLHQPSDMDALQHDSPARARLAYDELLAHQCMLQQLRKQSEISNCHVIKVSKQERESALASLPYQLTDDQHATLEAIYADMQSDKPMMRMVQGDVGCGKTIIAFLAMLAVAQSGKQAVLIAPTDLLARQHFASLQALAEKHQVVMALLTGKMPAAQKRKTAQAIADGAIQLAIGTHALFQEKIQFDDLALAVIDEQHRFGVNQRKKLLEKATNPHLLQLSATPIPRSLSMTLYGDLDVSIIKQRPPGRQPIDTRVLPAERIDEVIHGLARVFEKNERVYWVCPLITPMELDEEQLVNTKEWAAAEERFQLLEKHFPGKVGLVHGQMPVKAREEAMQRFIEGEVQLLVATTVIEVGVNVPEATVMIVEEANRFGLAQLHQLRGRVGRSELASSCILLYQGALSEVAKQRLQAIRTLQDGFALAEEDLRLRGGGDIIGTKQTGLPSFMFANILQDQQILRAAREDAQTILAEDSMLKTDRGQAVRLLLRLFGYRFESVLQHTA